MERRKNSGRISIRAKRNIKKLEDQRSTIKKYEQSLIMDREKLSHFIMIIQEWYLRLNINQFMEKD